MSLEERQSSLDPYTDEELIEALETGVVNGNVLWCSKYGIMHLAAQRLKELLAERETLDTDCPTGLLGSDTDEA